MKNNKETIYKYKNIKGTLLQLCYVFRKDITNVQKLMANNILFEDAMDQTKTARSKDKITFNDKNTEKYKLNKIESDLILKYYDSVIQIAHNKNCYDEDIISAAHVYLCELCHRYLNIKTNTPMSIYIHVNITRYILYLLKEQNSYLEIIDFDANDLLTSDKDDVFNTSVKNIIKDDISQTINSLSIREQKVLNIRYGLEDDIPKTIKETGEKLGVRDSRIRIIEQKALKKLRCPSKNMLQKEYLEVYN